MGLRASARMITDDDAAALENDATSPTEPEGEPILSDGYIIDYITGDRRVKDTPKEQVRQFIAHALEKQYNIALDDMETDFVVGSGKKRRVIDIAIFHPEQEHSVLHLSRAVICRPMPTLGRNATRLRNADEAEKDLTILKDIMELVESCEYGLWTNKLDIFYLKREQTRFDLRLESIADWPPAGESLKPYDPANRIALHKADKEMLRVTFRRCHNFIHGNEGMPKDAAFWQFLYLIFCKMHDENFPQKEHRFWVGMTEQFTAEGRERIKERISSLFTEVKERYAEIFRGNEEIILSPRALAFMVSELSRYDFTNSEIDAKGAAYQEIVGTNLRGDRGQYFTPRGVVKLAVEILAPRADERIFDPACGTGGFLVATLDYMLRQFCAQRGIDPHNEGHPLFAEVRAQLKAFAENNVYGADFDQFLIRASQMNMVMAGDGRGHLYHMNSLEFPNGHFASLERARQELDFGTIDVIMTNPPFGSDIPISETQILEQFEFARTWERDDDGQYRINNRSNQRRLQSSVAPEKLFIERCMQWLKPGGRMGIVVPNGILGNPADEHIRQWILKNAWVLASIDLPIEVFVVEANVNILTSLLFLKKKTDEEIRAEALGKPIEYPVFMAVAEKVGVDRRGNVLYKRNPDGEDLITVIGQKEVRQVVDGRMKVYQRSIYGKVVDDDLPVIAEQYHLFRQHYPEPGL
jgi:type I restriction enzyme M protein